ncbi:MAG: hypothetical protein CMA28_00110 [Euryarchaeota archaeon]|nr:hypothetical protein [Euryarchaeota archaeon]
MTGSRNYTTDSVKSDKPPATGMSKSEVRISLGEGSSHHELEFDPEQVTRTNLRIEGIPEGANRLTLQTGFTSSCPHCEYEAPIHANWSDQIRSAFIVPVSDTPVVIVGGMKNNLHSIRSEGGEIPISRWEEGGEAVVDIDLETFPGGHMSIIIETSWMDPGIGSGYYDGDQPHITISAWIDSVKKADCTLAFDMAHLPKNTDSNIDLIERLEKIEAYSLDGDGYSIHPKQILTVGVLERLLENELRHNSDLTITYLGSDTGENLYSVIRYLRESGLWDRVSSFDIFYHRKWDKQYFDLKKLKSQVEAVGEEFSFKKMFSSKAEDCPRESDVTICTYVSPWAFHETETPEDQQRFRDFLKQTMKDRGFLISVDPERDRYVRSRPYPPAFKIQHHLNHDNGWKRLDPAWGVDVPDTPVSNWNVLQRIIPQSGEGVRAKDVTGSVIAGRDINIRIGGGGRTEGSGRGGDHEEEEGVMGRKEALERVQVEYLESLISVLSSTRCASRQADASMMYYSPLRFVDGSFEFWKNVGESEFEEMSWMDLWKDGKSPASLFTNKETSSYIRERVPDWLESDIPERTEGTHVLTSEAGMGKSTSFRWMARKVAKARRDDRATTRMPILVSARKLERYLDMCELVVRGIPEGVSTHDFWMELFQQHQFTLDGRGGEAPKDGDESDYVEALEASLTETIRVLMRDSFTGLEWGTSDSGQLSGFSPWQVLSGEIGGMSQGIVVAREPTFEAFGSMGFEVEWLSCALAQAAFDTSQGLNITVSSPDLTELIAEAIGGKDLVLFVDALDECRDPRRTAKFLESATGSNGIVRFDPKWDPSSSFGTQDTGMYRGGEISEMYLSTRPERLESIPEMHRRRARFCKLQYDQSEMSEKLPRGLLRAWGIDSKRIMTLSLGARWKYPFAFLNPWAIGHALKMIDGDELELDDIDEWSDEEFIREILHHSKDQYGPGSSELMLTALILSGRKEGDSEWMDWEGFVEAAAKHQIVRTPMIRDLEGMMVNRHVMLKFAGLPNNGGLELFMAPDSYKMQRSRPWDYDTWFGQGDFLAPHISVDIGRRRSSREREARFFLSILESSVRNSLTRKRRIAGKSEEHAEGLVSEVTDVVGVISMINASATNARFRGAAAKGFENYLSYFWDLISSSSNQEHFPHLSKTGRTEFIDIFSNDLTSLYIASKRSTDFEWVEWEHKRMRDVAALRFWFGPDERTSKTREILSKNSGLTGYRSLEEHALGALSVDWIEIGFAVSENESYLDFLRNINRKATQRTRDNTDFRVAGLLWKLVVDNGYESAVIEEWRNYYTSEETQKRSDAPIPIPHLECPLEAWETLDLLTRKVVRGRMPFLPNFPELMRTTTVQKLVEIAKISFEIVDDAEREGSRFVDERIPASFAELWDVASGSRNYGMFAMGMLVCVIPENVGERREGNDLIFDDNYYIDLQKSMAAAIWSRGPRGPRYMRSSYLESRAMKSIDSTINSFQADAAKGGYALINWIGTLPNAIRRMRNRKESKGSHPHEVGIPLSKPYDQLIEERNSVSKRKGLGKAYSTHREMRWLDSLGMMILLFEPRYGMLQEDLAVFSSILEALSEIYSENESSDVMIRPEQLRWHELRGFLESEGMGREEKVESFVMADAGLYTRWTSRRVESAFRSGELLTSDGLNDQLRRPFEGLPNRDITGILNNLGIRGSVVDESRVDAVRSILEQRSLYDENLEELFEKLRNMERRFVDSYRPEKKGDERFSGSEYTEYADWIKELRPELSYRAVRSEFFIEKQGLKSFLSQNGIVSILYNDDSEDMLTRTMNTMTRAVLEQHKGFLDSLFGDLEEYYTPYR